MEKVKPHKQMKMTTCREVLTAYTWYQVIQMSQGEIQKPTSISKTLLQQAKVVGFYDQYKQNLELAADWITTESFDIPDDIKGLLFDELKVFGFLEIWARLAPVVYLRDLDYNPLAYLVADGMLIYVLPEVYNVPSQHSKAKVLPDLQIESILGKLVEAIENDNYYQLFESYNQAMLYGEFNMQDKCYSDYTRVEWMKLTEILRQDPKIVAKLDSTLAKIREDCYSIESIAKNIGWLLETELKECLKKVNVEGQL